MADGNKIKYGLSQVHYAVATIGSDNSATYGTPKAIKGAVNLSLDPQGDTNKFFADNIVYYTSVANNGYEGDLEIARIPEDFYKDILGYVADGNGVLYEDANAKPVHFALMFQFEGDVSAKRHVLYNCVATRPNIGSATKEDSIEPQTETISISATSIYAIDKDVVKASANTSETTAYNSWFSTVYTLTT